MNLKAGISIYSVPELSITTLIEFAEEHDFDVIELWDSPLPGSNNKLSRYLAAENRDLSVHAPLLDLGNDDTFERNSRSLRDFIERAGRWGATTVVLHMGKIKNGKASASVETATRVIDHNLNHLEKYDIMLCIENVGYLSDDLIRDFEHLAVFVDRFPKHLVGVGFDVAHANITEGVEYGIESLGDRIRHVHVSDNSGKSNNHHMPIGKGNIDFAVLKNCPLTHNSTVILEITSDDNWQTNLLNGRSVLQDLKLVE